MKHENKVVPQQMAQDFCLFILGTFIHRVHFDSAEGPVAVSNI
jgi:hypothetical protein